MSNRYKVAASADGLTYHFITDSGDFYTAYFTDFFLQNKNGEEIEIFSFGFERSKISPDAPDKFDAGIKATIQYILLEFFIKNPSSAVIYVCLTSDGMARNRRITFARWFSEFADKFAKADSYINYAEYSFYSSLLVAKDSHYKDDLIDAFYYTLDYWMGDDTKMQ